VLYAIWQLRRVGAWIKLVSVRPAGVRAPCRGERFVVTVTDKTQQGGRRRKFSTGFDRFSGLYLWALFIIVFGLWVPNEFLTTSTLHSVAAQQAVTGMIGLAVLIPLAAGLYDLSVGATANVSGILTIVLMNNSHWAVVPAIIAGVLVAVAIGCVNSLVVVKLGVNSFIATLGMGSILAALEVIISSNSQPIPPASMAWNNFTQTTVLGFQIVVLYLVILAFILWWLTAHTPVGRYLYAIGGNTEAARLSGVRIERYTTLALVTSATVAGLAGIMFSSLNGPSLDFGGTLLLPAFAAAFLGSTQLIPGRFNVWGTLLAIYVLATGVQGLQLVSGASWLNDMFNGVALIVAVALSIQRSPSNQWARIKARLRRGSAGGPADPGSGAGIPPEPIGHAEPSVTSSAGSRSE
jgi:ribose transport system permease protein